MRKTPTFFFLFFLFFLFFFSSLLRALPEMAKRFSINLEFDGDARPVEVTETTTFRSLKGTVASEFGIPVDNSQGVNHLVIRTP